MTCQIRLQNAKIATFGERAEDIFFITDKNNLPLNDEKQQKCLCDNIKNALNNQ
jgi:[protein-PII] uridylyltransferase